MCVKVCLINPPLLQRIRADYSDIIERGTGFYQPLGLQYLSSACKNKGYDVLIIDCEPEKLDYKHTVEKVKSYNPQIIGVTCMTFNLLDVVALLEGLKVSYPHVPIVVGGPHVNIFPRETLKFLCVDAIVVGEGEEVFPQVVNRLINNLPIEDLKGVGYKKNADIFINPEKAAIQELDSLSFPDRTLPFDNYFTAMSEGGKTAIMMTSRGCPYRCIYCDRPAMGKRFRARSPENVAAEIKECLSLGINEIMFFDDTFTVDRNRVIKICELIIERNLKFKWFARARVDTVDLELLMTMKKAGCDRISYGIESGNSQTLKILKKGISLEEARQAVENTKKAGIDVFTDFILGAPGEDRDAILRTVDFAISLNPDYVQFTIMTPFPGTKLYQMALSQGIIETDIWQEFAMNPQPGFNTPVWSGELTREELEELLVMAYSRFYRRPRYLLNRLMKINNLKELLLKVRAGRKVLTLKNFDSI